jgi:hypothetical protein
MIIPSSTHGVIASSRPRVVVAVGGDVTPTPALNWTGTLGCDDASPSQDYTEEQILGINEAITLAFTVTATSGTPPTVVYRKASTAASSSSGYGSSSNSYGGTPSPEGTHNGLGFTTLYDGATLVVSSLSVSSGDYLAFIGSANAPPFGTNSVTIRINNQSDANAVIDTITFQQSGCYLTTTVVEYMGLADNGPELTAMRQLREYYIGVPGYADLIQEYYQTSPAIITAINALADPSVEYTYIYNTVVSVMNHINGGEWQQAHDLYMAMYNDLKTRYMG